MRCIIGALFLATSTCLVFGKDGDELKGVVVLFRHGDRAPLSAWPNDLYFNNETIFPDGHGQLNNLGKQRHLRLGQWFRERYDGFLPRRYNAKDIYVKSTDVDRTLMSAASNLAGLYPPEGDQVWNETIPWQPIPIHTVPQNQDPILTDVVPCPKRKQLREEFLNSTEVAEWEDSLSELYANLSVVTGYSIEELSISKFSGLFQTIVIYRELNLTLPEWTDTYWSQIKALSSLPFQYYTWTPELARLQIGPFHDYLINHFNAIEGNSSETATKFLMLSAHDTTVSDITNSMGVFANVVPEFATTLIWEMKSDYINFYYKNSTHFEELTLPGCDFDCPLEQYITLLQPITVSVEQWSVECSYLN